MLFWVYFRPFYRQIAVLPASKKYVNILKNKL